MPKRLAIVLSHPVQYYSPWFRWMSAHAGFRLRVFYLWDAGVNPARDPQFGKTFSWDVDLLSGYEYEFIPNTARQPGSDHFSGLVNPGLPGRLEAWRPDAVLVFGYKYATHLGLILWARLQNIPLVFRGDSHLLGHAPLSWKKRLSLSLLYRQFSAFACVGAANRDYFRAFAVPARKLFAVPHCVDAGYFTASTVVYQETDRLRAKLGLAGKRVVLFAGKLIPDKQPAELLTAFLAISPTNTALVFVGDGLERSHLEHLAATRSDLPIHFLPFANQSEMPSRYLLADLFVLPSRGLYETWGLAINEAMHLGIPCVVSDRVGCQRDLVTDGETGWVFNSEHPDALTNTLRRALTDLAHHKAAFRARIATRIANYTYETATLGLERTLNALFSE